MADGGRQEREKDEPADDSGRKIRFRSQLEDVCPSVMARSSDITEACDSLNAQTGSFYGVPSDTKNNKEAALQNVANLLNFNY
mmetsp:Transcript_40109/g.93924  ORF Transcript_40109/g.93924 Transcript_40109/m.93924 type:complete len:83 (-) Transcript_40109:1036-1284(-)